PLGGGTDPESGPPVERKAGLPGGRRGTALDERSRGQPRQSADFVDEMRLVEVTAVARQGGPVRGSATGEAAHEALEPADTTEGLGREPERGREAPFELSRRQPRGAREIRDAGEPPAASNLAGHGFDAIIPAAGRQTPEQEFFGDLGPLRVGFR